MFIVLYYLFCAKIRRYHTWILYKNSYIYGKKEQCWLH